MHAAPRYNLNKTFFFAIPHFIVIIIMACSGYNHESRLLSIVISGKLDTLTITGNPGLRGLDVLNDSVAWVSGSFGNFARSIDGGKNWSSGKINNDTLLDFRDIHAFSTESAVVLSAGSPSRVYKTYDGGKTWQLKYENLSPSVFFNAFDFHDDKNGIACGDPVNGSFLLIETSDAGETWDTINTGSLPKPLEAEAGFATSGTSVEYSSNGIIMYGTGGNRARIIRSADFGKHWGAITTPIQADDSAAGIFSIVHINNKIYMVAGGSWEEPDDAINNVAMSTDSGETWKLTPSFPGGFRSCIRYLATSKVILLCGPNGADISSDMGKTWQKIPIQGFNTVDISDSESFIVFVGSEGRLAWVSTSNLF